MTAMIRPCRNDETPAMLTIINDAAEAYRGAIPPDCWHEPYMSAAELDAEMAAGVRFVGYEREGELAGVMGLQTAHNVDLIRHAYVASAFQGQGIGSALMDHLRGAAMWPLLVGTWSAATWAIGFYERHGFQLVPSETKELLLRTYWTVSDRQIETSVVLARPPLDRNGVENLVAEAQAMVPASFDPQGLYQ